MLGERTRQPRLGQVLGVRDEPVEAQPEGLPVAAVELELTAGQVWLELSGGGGGTCSGGAGCCSLRSDPAELIVICAVAELEIIQSHVA